MLTALANGRPSPASHDMVTANRPPAMVALHSGPVILLRLP